MESGWFKEGLIVDEGVSSRFAISEGRRESEKSLLRLNILLELYYLPLPLYS